MRRTAVFCVMAWSVLATAAARPAAAACSSTAPCVDAEPMWLSPSAGPLLTVSDTAATPTGFPAFGATFGFRLRPAVLTVPAPNKDGRDVNMLRLATDLSVAARLGIGNRIELTLLLPAGLYQRGAGIKGITDQSAPAIAVASLHDPRLGFGYALPTRSPLLGLKVRFDAKLPLGNAEALSGEQSFVAAPSVAVSTRSGNFFGGAELGARLRRPTSFFGIRIGSQFLFAAGLGYELARPRISFAGELYLLPSLIGAGSLRYVPAEWLASTRFAPRELPTVSFGAAGGSGLPLSGKAAGTSIAFGVPTFRALVFVRVTPGSD